MCCGRGAGEHPASPPNSPEPELASEQGALVGALGPRQLGAALNAHDRLSAHSTAVGHLRDKSRAPDSAVKHSAFSVVLSEPRAGKGFLCFIFLTSPVPPAPSVAPVLPAGAQAACRAAVVCRPRLTVGEVDGPRRLRTPLAVRKHAQNQGVRREGHGLQTLHRVAAYWQILCHG